MKTTWKIPWTCMQEMNKLWKGMKLFTQELHTIDNYLLVLILASQNQTNSGGLAKLLKLKIGPKIMSTVDIGIQDRLINGQIVNIRYIEFAQGSAHKVYVKFFDEQACLKAIRSSYLGKQDSGYYRKIWTWESNKENINISIKHTQFPLILPWESTIHKIQGLSFEKGAIDFDLWKQKLFGSRQIYSMLSSIKTYNLYRLGELKKFTI